MHRHIVTHVHVYVQVVQQWRHQQLAPALATWAHHTRHQQALTLGEQRRQRVCARLEQRRRLRLLGGVVAGWQRLGRVLRGLQAAWFKASGRQRLVLYLYLSM